jgi:hypothetical protein
MPLGSRELTYGIVHDVEDVANGKDVPHKPGGTAGSYRLVIDVANVNAIANIIGSAEQYEK